MTVTGIIAEYNPLHKGHEYQLKEARRLTGADYIVVVMSGCFTQRGTPAVLDKYDRARMALSCGADLVLELPARFACASAEYFASGAVSVLNRLGCVDYLCFGSECGNTQALLAAAALLSEAEKSPEYQEGLREAQRDGLSFPAARSRALKSFSQTDPSLFSLPNNILGIEYCRALAAMKSPIRPFSIQRRGNYHDTQLKETADTDVPFSSASAVRAALREGGSDKKGSCQSVSGGRPAFPASGDVLSAPEPRPATAEESLRSSLPEISRRLLFERQDGRGVLTEEDFSSLLRYRLLQLLENGNGQAASSLTAFADITPSLAGKIGNHLYSFTGWDDFCLRLRSRDLPYARASRSLCHILLDLRQDALNESKAKGFPVYLRMLGFSERALPLLSAIKKQAASPLLSRLTAARQQLSPMQISLLEEEIRASHIYQTVVSGKYGTPFLHEYQRRIICPPFL